MPVLNNIIEENNKRVKIKKTLLTKRDRSAECINVKNDNRVNGFYQLNNVILSQFTCNDVDQIRFNHYIMRKENVQRLKNDLPRGQFYLTLRTASTDLKLPFAKIQRLVKKFVELEIITSVFIAKKGSKKPSIYKYNSVAISDTKDDIMNNTEEFKDTKDADEIVDTLNDTYDDTSKKEYIKEINNYIETDDF